MFLSADPVAPDCPAPRAGWSGCTCDADKLRSLAPQKHGGEPIIPFSGKFESKLFDMPDDEKAAYCKEVQPVCLHMW